MTDRLQKFKSLALEPRLADSTRVALSHALFDNHDQRLAHVHGLLVSLAWYARAAAWVDGEKLPAISPAMPTGPYNAGETVMRRVGISREQLAETWLTAKETSGVAARMRDDLLVEFVPPALWPVVAAMILDGPAVATQRLAASQRLVAKEVRVEATRQRPAGPPTRTTLTGRMNWVRKLMGHLCRLRTVRPDDPYLAGWLGLPPADADGAGAVIPIDRSAPPRALVRRSYAIHHGELLRRLNCAPDSVLERVRELSGAQLVNTEAWRLLRNLCALLLMAVVGCRREALSRLRIADLVRRPSPARGTSWVLLTRPIKSLAVDEIRPKPIPDGLAQLLLALIEMTDKLVRFSRPDGAPILAAKLTEPLKPMVGARIGDTFSGSWPRKADKRGKRVSFLPRDPAALERIHRDPDVTDPARYIGYHPHSLRGAAMQMVRKTGTAFLELTGEAEAPEPLILAEILVDHAIPGDVYGYYDINTPHGREQYAGLAIEIAWAALTTDLGARRGIDVEAWRRTAGLRDAVEAELARAARDIERSAVQLAALTRQADEVARCAGARGDLDGLLLRGWAAERAHSTLRDRRNELLLRLKDLDDELHALKHDRLRRVPVDDTVPDREIVTSPQLLEREVEGAVTIGGRRYRRVRQWCSIAEFAEIAGKAPVTVRRWAAGQSLPFREGDPRRPWEPGEGAVERLSEHRQIVWVELVKPTFFDTDAKRLALEQVLSRAHETWAVNTVRTEAGTS